MSPSWRERIVVALGAEALTAVRIARGWQPKVVAQRELPLAKNTDDDLRVAFQMLLNDTGWRRGAVDVVLAEDHVRYAIVPVDPHLHSQADRTAFAQLILRQTYGDDAAQWATTVSPARLTQPTVVCGVPRALLDQIRTTCKGRLRSVQPGLMHIVNQHRRRIGQRSGWLALMTPARITLATIEDGRWDSLYSRPVTAGDPKALATALEEAQSLQPQTLANLWLCNLTELDPVALDAWQVDVLAPRHGGASSTAGYLTWSLP